MSPPFHYQKKPFRFSQKPLIPSNPDPPSTNQANKKLF
jgi:hypothetical protein